MSSGSATRVLEQPAGDVAGTVRLQFTHSRRHYRPQVSQEIRQIRCFSRFFPQNIYLTSVVDPAGSDFVVRSDPDPESCTVSGADLFDKKICIIFAFSFL